MHPHRHIRPRPEVSATSPSIPAVLRPALRCATRRTLTSVLARLRSISFCRFLTLGQSSSLLALKIRCRSRSTSRSGPAQTIESHSSALSPARRSSGPFTMRRLTCPSVRAVPALGLQRLTCPRQHAFASRTGRVSGQLYETASGGTSHVASFSCCLSATGIRFLGILPAREFRPSHDRPTGRPVLRRLDPDQVSVFRTHETRLGLAVLSTPGTAVSTRPEEHLGRRLPPLNGRPLPPCAATRHQGVRLTRHQQGFTGIHPIPSLPLTCDPRTDRGSLGFTLSSAPG